MKTTTAVNCEQLIPGLPLPKLPRLISGEGAGCRWSGHSGAPRSSPEKPSPGLWPVSVLLGSMEWLIRGFQAWGGISPQVLQPGQPDRRFSWQPLLLKPSLSEAEPTTPAREQQLEALKASLIPDNLPPWQQQTLSEQWQRLHQSLPDVETPPHKTGTVQLIITIIDQHIRVALSSPKPVSNQQLISFNTALHNLLLAIYQMTLEQEPIDDSQADDYSPMVSAAGGGGDDDDNNDHGFGQDDKLPDIILDFALLPALLAGTDSDLLTLSILEQRSRLRQLRRRLATMIASGRSTMAAILQDRIMVIEADEEDLLNLAVSPEQKGQKILPLLEKMLESLTEDTLMPAEYDYSGNLRKAPVREADTPKNSQNTLSGQGASGTSPNNVRSQKQPGQISGRRTNDDDDDDQRPGQKKTVANRTPETICSVCGQLIQKNEPVVISSTDNRVYCQKHQPANILLLPEVVLRLLAEYLTWEDLIALTSTCRHFRVLGQNNPVHLYLKPLVRKMLGDKQKADITQKAYGIEKEIEHRLRHFKIPESVIAKAIQADTTIYLQALHNYLLRYKIPRFTTKSKKCLKRILCLQSLSDGRFACGLGSGEVVIVNEELEEQRSISSPFEEHRSLFDSFFALFRKKKPAVVSITELSDHRLLLGVTDYPDRFEKKEAIFIRAVDKVLTGVALWDAEAETETWFVFPGAAIEPGISAMVPLADHRLAFYHHRSRSLHVWSTHKGAERELLTLAMESPVAGMLYQEAEQRLLIGHVSGMVSVWSTGQTDPSPPRNLLTPDQFSKDNPNSEVMSIKLFSDNRLAMAFPGHVWIWNIATEPVLFHLNLTMSQAGQANLSSRPVEEPVVESWVELHDRRLAILFRWPSQYGPRIRLIFWDTSSCDNKIAFDSEDHSYPGLMSELSVYGMMPLFGQHLLLASQRGEVILWCTMSGGVVLECSANREFVDCIDLEPPLFILSGSRILTCFGGRYLCILDMLCDQKDQ